MHSRHTQFGYSLVEVLVAISVLSIAIIGPMTIAAQGIKSSRFALEQNSAFFLAQEGIESLFYVRNNYALQDIDDGLESSDPDTSWDWLTELQSGPCSDDMKNAGETCSFGIEISGNLTSETCTVGDANSDCRLYIEEGNKPLVYSHDSSGEPSPYTRVVTVSYVSDDSVKIESTVTWDSSVFGGQQQSVTLTSYLFDSNYEQS